MICDKAFHDVEDFGLDKIKKRLIECLAAVHLKELNAGNEAWEMPAITVACEEPAQQTETAALSMQVILSYRLHLPVIPVPSINPLLFAPLPTLRSSSTKGLFVGPPCAGKISLSQSIARAFGRPFFWWCS